MTTSDVNFISPKQHGLFLTPSTGMHPVPSRRTGTGVDVSDSRVALTWFAAARLAWLTAPRSW
ncbi:MAG: hypothetical protein PXZ08_03155 [Actinomycetota bacterium]|nr:hypothetical protein [Actinomycetota bacterium]